jgi:hypothetical protein
MYVIMSFGTGWLFQRLGVKRSVSFSLFIFWFNKRTCINPIIAFYSLFWLDFLTYWDQEYVLLPPKLIHLHMC